MYEYLQMIDIPDKCAALIANPQFPPNNLGYLLTPNNKHVFIPPWYFVNETNDAVMRSDLIKYFSFIKRAAKNVPLLNFRNSIIRQISLGYALKYSSIHICGLDPSLTNYWINSGSGMYHLDQRSSISSNHQVIEKFTKSLDITSKSPVFNCFHRSSQLFDFNRSIFLIIRKYLQVHPEISIILHCNDSSIISIIDELRLNKFSSFYLDQQLSFR